MASANTFKTFSQAYPSGHPFALPAAFTTTSATETAFLLSNGTQAVMSIPTGTEILGSQVVVSQNANSALSREGGRSAAWFSENRPFFNSSSFSGHPFHLRACGYVAGGGTTATSVTASINLYANLTNAATVTSGTKIASVSLGNIGAVSGTWMIDYTLGWDSVSKVLYGTLAGFNGASSLQITGTSTSVTGITSVALTNLNFGLTWTFATTSTSNAIGLVELGLEQI